MDELVRRRIRVEGVVQGVGFRPFVHSVATGLGLGGHVGNDARGVIIEAEGPEGAIADLVHALRTRCPPLAVVEEVTVSAVPPLGERTFRVVDSADGGPRTVSVPADVATCEDCLREISDPADRRHGYAFTNCTGCGPRFTIVRDIPYDRGNTTMADFPLCPACAAEYHDPANRRFHAQPVCCPECGPRLRLVDAAGNPLPGDPVDGAAAALAQGAIVAVKGLGGFHLAVDATDDDAASALRKRKNREAKPFAVMVADLERARQLCSLDDAEAALLTSRRRPIVLLDRLPHAPVAPAVAPGNTQLGLLLPYTPVHHLLLRRFPKPIVLTSGNASDEPIAHRDDDALQRLSSIADVFLTHDRPIHAPADDSVVRAFRGKQLVLRRSRGYTPEPVVLPWEFPRPVLACGAELKNTFALAERRKVVLSQHIGDLEDYPTFRSYGGGIEHFRALLGIDPQVVVHDLHPEYLSTKYAEELDDVELLGVQHHHAHIASCLADNGHPGPVVGVAFDGLGYGPDGTLWGGEFLLADLAGYRRVGHLEPVPLPGGAAAVRQPWRVAVSYLVRAYGNDVPAGLALLRRRDRWARIAALTRTPRHSPLSSSAGRLFDAVAALLGVRDVNDYEGQAAIELEQLADPTERGRYELPVSGGDVLRLRGADLIREVVNDVLAGAAPSAVAARFHNAVGRAIVEACVRVRDSTGVRTAALSGGVFQNALLLDRTTAALRARGFQVLVHSRVPPNDGGISLGQAAVAGALDRGRES
ncbi:carbamoyltransferase HypF [Saccharopolyspora thermophila]|uniref:carbamoyltransferase HypF n=1 Tax=Saccharopolyspora thermophila TaxID=89367 RepID=UPI00166434D9|nr:carbamoyltransferase HypF [Saccharopolyspora subtropica]